MVVPILVREVYDVLDSVWLFVLMAVSAVRQMIRRHILSES
jgi:hypothetical protein